MTALELERDEAVAAPAVKAVGQLGTRDRPALATLVDAYPLNRPGSDQGRAARRARPVGHRPHL